MIRPILIHPDPRLKKLCEPVAEVTADMGKLAEDMLETMYAAPGIGLAAPQIGVNLQLVIFGFGRNARYPDAPAVPETVLLNPVLEPLSDDMEEGWEGCLSVPGLRGWVPRHARLRYRGVDPFGKAFVREVDGFHARVVQHECDHLAGLLYPMRIKDFSRFGFTEVLFPASGGGADD